MPERVPVHIPQPVERLPVHPVVVGEHRLHVDHLVAPGFRPVHEVPPHNIMAAPIPPVLPTLRVAVGPDTVHDENDLGRSQPGSLGQHPQKRVYHAAGGRHQIRVSRCRIGLPEGNRRRSGGVPVVATLFVVDDAPRVVHMVVAVLGRERRAPPAASAVAREGGRPRNAVANGCLPRRLLRTLGSHDSPHERQFAGIEVTIDRDRTLYLPRGGRAEGLAEEFLDRFPSADRVWYVAHRTLSEAVVGTMTNAWYTVQIVDETNNNSKLFLGTR